MKFIGFNLTKIGIDKKTDNLKDIKVDTKINLLDIEAVETNLTQEGQEMIRLKFLYEITYDPDVAKIDIGGNIILIGNKEETDKVLDDWKDKKVSEGLRIQAFNIILRKGNVKALELEEDMNLPLHLPLPSLKSEAPQETPQEAPKE